MGAQVYLELGLLGAFIFFCSNFLLWRKKLWEVSVERLESDLPQTTTHTVVEPGLLALIQVFFPMLLLQLPDPLAAGIKPGPAGLAAGRSFPPKPGWFQYHPRGCKVP